MTRVSLLAVALCAPLLLVGCDTSGPDAPPSRNVVVTPTTDAGPTAPLVLGSGDARTTPFPNASTSSAETEKVGASARLATASAKSHGFTYTIVDNPEPVKTIPSDATTVSVLDGSNQSNVITDPCDPEDEPGCEVDPGDPGTGGGGTTPDVTNMTYFSRIVPLYPDVVSMESHSYASDSTGQLKNIPYIGVTGSSFGNGWLLFQKSAGTSNGAYAIVQGYAQKGTSVTVSWHQEANHTFTLPTTPGQTATYNYTSDDDESF